MSNRLGRVLGTNRTRTGVKMLIFSGRFDTVLSITALLTPGHGPDICGSNYIPYLSVSNPRCTFGGIKRNN